MPRVVHSTYSFVGSGQRIIVAATLICNRTQRQKNKEFEK